MDSEQDTNSPQIESAQAAARAALAETIVRETVGLMAVAIVLLAMDQRFRIWLRGEIAWISNLGRRSRHAQDQEVARFRKDISDYEHEAARKDRGCGCG